MSKTPPPTLLEEFASGLDAVTANPSLVTMANAKWMGGLISAIAEANAKQSISIEEVCEKYKEIAKTLIAILKIDTTDPRLMNTALQAIQTPATNELRSTGQLTGLWIENYAAAIKAMPGYFRVVTSPVASSTSLGMTLANHYAELYALTNHFSYLQDPAYIVDWSHKLIDKAAKTSAGLISLHEDLGSTYQNQLNVHRKLFSSAYRSEAKQWETLLAEDPGYARLYINGIPLTGVEIKFQEQATEIQNLLGFEVKPQTIPITR